jgi:hypothetical protein
MVIPSTGHTLEKIQPWAPMPPRLSRPSNLSDSDKELVLALGLEEVYKCMAENHKFHIDLVQVVAAGCHRCIYLFLFSELKSLSSDMIRWLVT